MTRRDYVALADAIRSADRNQTMDPIAEVTSAIADLCGEDNGRFDRVRFLKACGMMGRAR